jgi:sulfate permease, SulP family
MAALTTGIANVPDGMASGALAGVNPVHGVYTLIVGTPLASIGLSTQLMMVNTTSAMTLVAVDGLGDRSGPDRVAALLVIALMAGIVQIALGVLGLGMLTKFVPNSVMTGFLTGIGVSIILGQLWDFTGYDDDAGGSRLQRTARLIGNLSEIDPWTSAIGVGTLALMILLARGPLANFNLLVGLAAATAVVWIANPESVAIVTSLGEITQSLPGFELPRLSLIPTMLFPAVAVALVGLLQAAGVAQAYPNPDGSRSSDSRDFIAQGIGNTASSCFSGMAGGGSLSGTALNVSAGATSRWAAVMQAGVVLVLVLVFADVLSRVPMAALAALLIYAAMLSFKLRAIETIRKTSPSALASMGITFLATLVIPLQQAVVLGALLAAALFIYRASVDILVQQVVLTDGRMFLGQPPEALPSNAVTVLDIQGNLFYAGARTLERLLPRPADAVRPVVVLRIRGQRDLGSTALRVISSYSQELERNGGRLILAGAEKEVLVRLQRTGLIDEIGPESVFAATELLGQSVEAAVGFAEHWLKQPAPA